MDAKLILGILGNAINILTFLSPAPTFWRTVKNKSTEQFSGLPYAVTLFNCLLWVLYGLPLVVKGGILILTTNGTGVGTSLIFLTPFFFYTDRKSRLKIGPLLAVFVLTVITIACIILLAVKRQPMRKRIVGSICVVVTVAFYSSPLSVMKMVIQTKSVAFMPFFLSLFMALNDACWTLYGVVSKDIFVALPNCVGLAFAICQLVLHVIYRRNQAVIDLEEGPQKQPNELDATKAAVTVSQTRLPTLDQSALL